MGSEQLLLTISFIEQKDDYLIIHFVKPSGFRFNPGQYGAFKHLKEITGRQVMAFSFISTPDEDELVIAMKIKEDGSEFKQEMLNLEVKDHMIMVGPLGSFSFEEEASSIFIAEGIGIAPFMSMMKHFDDEVELVYASKDVFLFQDEIEQLSYVDAKYTSDFFDTQADVLDLIKGNDESLIYIVGTETFVSDIKDLLISNYIDENLIVEDNYIRI